MVANRAVADRRMNPGECFRRSIKGVFRSLRCRKCRQMIIRWSIGLIHSNRGVFEPKEVGEVVRRFRSEISVNSWPLLIGGMESSGRTRKFASIPMLRELHISNLAVIEDVRISFGSGLNVITGKTGAGLRRNRRIFFIRAIRMRSVELSR